MASFDERAAGWDTDARAARARLVADAIRAAVPVGPATRILELGAGTGLLGLALARGAGEVVLADASPGMLAEAAAKVAAAGLGHVRTLRLELGVDPLPAERFDLCTSLMALHHVPDTAAALAAMAALVQPGGHLALVDLDAEDGTFHDDPAAEVHHGFPRDALAAAVGAAGFRDVALATVHVMEKRGRRYPLFLLTAVRA